MLIVNNDVASNQSIPNLKINIENRRFHTIQTIDEFSKNEFMKSSNEKKPYVQTNVEKDKNANINSFKHEKSTQSFFDFSDFFGYGRNFFQYSNHYHYFEQYSVGQQHFYFNQSFESYHFIDYDEQFYYSPFSFMGYHHGDLSKNYFSYYSFFFEHDFNIDRDTIALHEKRSKTNSSTKTMKFKFVEMMKFDFKKRFVAFFIKRFQHIAKIKKKDRFCACFQCV